MKTKIAIALPYAFSIRDFVSSGTLDQLLRDERVAVTIYTLQPELPELESVRRPNVSFRSFKAYADSFGERLLKTLYLYFFADQFAYVRIGLQARPLNRALAGACVLLRKLLGTRRTIRAIGWGLIALNRRRRLPALLDSDTDLFIGTRSLLGSIDYGLVAEAAARNIRTLTIAASWDNFTSKGYCPFAALRTIVWNGKMKQELEDIFGMPEREIRIAGYPRAAILRDSVRPQDAASYLESIGITGFRRFVMYSASYSELTRVSWHPVPLEYEIAKTVCASIEPELPEDVCILVRLHPFCKESEREYFAGLKRCFVYVPGRKEAYQERVMNRDDEEHLATQIARAECIVSMASTMSIDALCLGQHIINVDYDPLPGVTFTDSVRRFYHFNHFRDLLGIAKLPRANSVEDVRRFVAECLGGTYRSPVDEAAFERMYVPELPQRYPEIIGEVVKELAA